MKGWQVVLVNEGATVAGRSMSEGMHSDSDHVTNVGDLIAYYN